MGMATTTIHRNGEHTNEVFHSPDGHMIAILTHPCPRAPWWLHLTINWPGGTPDTPTGHGGGYKFRTRKAAHQWVTDQLTR